MPTASFSKARLSHKPGRRTKSKQQPTASTESTATRQAREPSALRQRATAPAERVPQAQTRNYTTNMHGEGNAINGDFHGTLENHISRGRAKTDPPPYTKRQPYDYENWNPAYYAPQLTEEPTTTLQSGCPTQRHTPQLPRPPLRGHAQTYPPCGKIRAEKTPMEVISRKFKTFVPHLIDMAGGAKDPWNVPDGHIWELWISYISANGFPPSSADLEKYREEISRKGQYELKVWRDSLARKALSHLADTMDELDTVESRRNWVSERLTEQQKQPLCLPLYYKKIARKNGEPIRSGMYQAPIIASTLGHHMRKIEGIPESLRVPSVPIGALILSLQASWRAADLWRAGSLAHGPHPPFEKYALHTAYHARQMARFQENAEKTNPGQAWEDVLELARESLCDSSEEEEEFFSGSGGEELVDDSDSDLGEE